MPTATLILIAVTVALMLSLFNKLTFPIIKEREENKVNESLGDVMEGKFTKLTLGDDLPTEIDEIYRVTDGEALKGHVMTLKVTGYAGQIYMTVGVSAKGRITKAKITSQNETHNRPEMQSYTERFTDKNKAEVESVDVVAGATVSSTAIRSGVLIALDTAEKISGTAQSSVKMKSPRTDEEILSLIKKTSGDIKLADKTPDEYESDIFVKLYESDSEGYFAYIAVSGEYVEVASESIAQFDKNGRIVNFSIISWVVGHGVGPDDLAERFIGKKYDTVDGVELLSGATYTSGDLRGAVKEVSLLIPRSFPIARAVGIATLVISLVVWIASGIIYRRRRMAK